MHKNLSFHKDLTHKNLKFNKDLNRNLIIKSTNYGLAQTVALFTNARDESHIKEWAAHHLLIGFDHVIIFDHKSIIPLTDVFQNFDKRVTIIRYEGDKNVKLTLMNNAIKMAQKLNVDWFIYLDADEFIILNNNLVGIKHLLNKYKGAESLALNWLLFGSNNLINEPAGLILDNYTKSDLMLNKHVKTFARPFAAVNAINPHFYNVQNKSRMMSLNKVLNGSEQYSFNTWNIPYYKAPAYIAHYLYQSEETYIKRKVNLPADDTGIKRNNIVNQIHNMHNAHDNMYPKMKYAENVNKFLQQFNK